MIPIYVDNPGIGNPILTILIIASCVLVWLWQIGLGPDQQKAIIYYGLIPSVLLGNIDHPGSVIPFLTIFIPNAFALSSIICEFDPDIIAIMKLAKYKILTSFILLV